MRTKRFLAVLLATTMVLGSAVTAFATDPTASASGTGNVDGAGTPEGYVDTNVVKVVLPTATTTTFAFIMDPQKMLEATDGARLGTAWTQPDDDTYVYFHTSSGYANKSDTVFFINKCEGKKLDVTVTAKATNSSVEGATTISLVAESALADAEEAKLYLGLNAAGTTKAIDTTGVSVKVTADNPANSQYTVVYNSKTKKYELAEVAGATFQAVPIQIEGAVATFATSKVAPSLNVKWDWAEHATSFAADEDAETVGYVTTNAFTITNATLDQTAGGYYGGIARADGKLAINGTTNSIITFADEVDKVEFSATPSNATTYAANTALVTAKGKVVTIKGSVWNATGTNAISSGSKIKVTFKDPDGDGALTAPTEIYFEK